MNSKYSTPKKYVKPLCQKEEDLYANRAHQNRDEVCAKDCNTTHTFSVRNTVDLYADSICKDRDKIYANERHNKDIFFVPNPLRQAWVNYLNTFNWDWFTTLTFKDLPKTYTAKNKAIRWLKTLQRQERRKVGYYMVMEFTRAGTPHLHLLMGNLEGVRRDKYWKLWFEKNGRARILPFEKNRGVRYYLTKYIIKGEYVNFGIWEVGNLELLRQQFLSGT